MALTVRGQEPAEPESAAHTHDEDTGGRCASDKSSGSRRTVVPDSNRAMPLDNLDTLPFLAYGRQSIDEADIAAVVEALRSDYLTTGPRVDEFEERLAERVGARFAVAVANGTAALHAAYFAAGVGPNDEVIVPALTFIATANAARYLGAEPVFADVDPDTGLVTPESVAQKLSPRTRVVAPVHLTGMPVDLSLLGEVLTGTSAVLVEDAAHALGAEYRGAPIGSCRESLLSTFSFHPVKHVTTGEGGAITTNDARLDRRMRVFRSHGMVHDTAELRAPAPGPWYYEQQLLGYNYRITDLQCALGISQLRKLSHFLARRRELAALYDKLLLGVRGVTPVARQEPHKRSAYHLYSVLIDFERFGKSRAQIMLALRQARIGTQVHYMPVPSQPYYRARGHDPATYPGACAYSERTLSLPLYPALADRDVERVITELCRALGA